MIDAHGVTVECVGVLLSALAELIPLFFLAVVRHGLNTHSHSAVPTLHSPFAHTFSHPSALLYPLSTLLFFLLPFLLFLCLLQPLSPSLSPSLTNNNNNSNTNNSTLPANNLDNLDNLDNLKETTGQTPPLRFLLTNNNK
jgi:hypothetical protein